MFSYNSNSENLVSKICQFLKKENIPVWFDRNGDQKDCIYKRYEHKNIYIYTYLTVTLHMNFFMRSLADGVENAVMICCFVTPDYGKSENCKFEVEYAQKRGKPLIPCNLGNASTWKLTAWLKSITRENIWIDFHDVSESNIDSKIRELVGRIHEQCLSTPYSTSQSAGDATYLFELMKHQYNRNSRIERFINPAKSFPIEDSYIN